MSSSKYSQGIHRRRDILILRQGQFELSDPPKDAISAIKFAPTSLQLLVASWDKNVYLYEIAGSSGKMLRTFEHRAPVLDICWDENKQVAYSAGLDWDVRR